MEIKHIIGNLYSIYGEYYIQLPKSPYNPPIITTMIDHDYMRIKSQYYIKAIDYIQANCGYDIWIYPGQNKIIIQLATDELKQNILEGITTYINAPYYIKYDDDMFKIIFNKN